MKKLSNTFKDSPETPLERGIFWIEYAIRHGGADFLNPKSRDMPFYKFMGIDLLAFFISSSVLIFVLIFHICKYFCRSKGKEKIH